MRTILFEELLEFCRKVLEAKGMEKELANITAEVLSVTDAFGIHSHGTKNLYSYLKKIEARGMEMNVVPEIVTEGDSFALLDAKNGFGIVASYKAMDLACKKAKNTGVALVTVRNSSHFGAAGYYANQAAKKGLFGIAMSNVDPNMTVPGARGKVLGNNPFSYASPLGDGRTIFLDIAMSSVASLKVIQAKKEGKTIPDTWIVDKDGRPTTDPSGYPETAAMQPMAAHKGYGLAVMVELLTGVISGGGISSTGDIVSWCFEIEKHNNVAHTFIAIDIKRFIKFEDYLERSIKLVNSLHQAPKAVGIERIYLPGEIEWERYKDSLSKGIVLPDDVVEQLELLSDDTGISLNWK